MDGSATCRDSAISCRGTSGLRADVFGQTTEQEDRGITAPAAGVPKHPATLRSSVNSHAVRRSLTYEQSMTRGSRKVVRSAARRDSFPGHPHYVGSCPLGADRISTRD